MNKGVNLLERKDKTDKDRVKEILNTTSDNTQYFKTRLHEIAFYFSIAHSNPIFDKELGIKRVHQKDVEKARSLKKAYRECLHPDKHIEDNSGVDFDELSGNVEQVFFRVSGGKL
ncbi:hypothetical protein P3647_10855 [Vibrio parahaemolyticus]|uniref:hypothetical protein n=1 Tax=Vibrio parahaemolyticus TaxID=670 RepID=UPI001B81E5CB|nr:hypothetical protein [Vibrio parahaemolyticus]MDF5205751.1 hypothetical protein [Vibrio parahaemolyticus]MDF5215671.1 hypothetical protein [Vibrio parahaemolyticus]HBC3413547.1 hypothetical protein [Vibrio parahaemolyticus]HBC3598953.1 hypothetical protein [Vibrio parahaemolyticus]HBC3875325.1 hypothetical protein [Vibrio parahaemolyticus]